MDYNKTNVEEMISGRDAACLVSGFWLYYYDELLFDKQPDHISYLYCIL